MLTDHSQDVETSACKYYNVVFTFFLPFRRALCVRPPPTSCSSVRSSYRTRYQVVCDRGRDKSGARPRTHGGGGGGGDEHAAAEPEARFVPPKTEGERKREGAAGGDATTSKRRRLLFSIVRRRRFPVFPQRLQAAWSAVGRTHLRSVATITMITIKYNDVVRFT